MMKEVTKKQEEVDVLEIDEVQHKVIIYNDDVNTFDYVISCLIEICEHDLLQAEQLTLLIHYKGKATVKAGAKEDMETICTALCDRDLSAVLV